MHAEKKGELTRPSSRILLKNGRPQIFFHSSLALISADSMRAARTALTAACMIISAHQSPDCTWGRLKQACFIAGLQGHLPPACESTGAELCQIHPENEWPGFRSQTPMRAEVSHDDNASRSQQVCTSMSFCSVRTDLNGHAGLLRTMPLDTGPHVHLHLSLREQL